MRVAKRNRTRSRFKVVDLDESRESERKSCMLHKAHSLVSTTHVLCTHVRITIHAAGSERTWPVGAEGFRTDDVELLMSRSS